MNHSVMTHKLKTFLFQSFSFLTIHDVAVTIETSLGLNLAVKRFVVVVRVPFVSFSSKSHGKNKKKKTLDYFMSVTSLPKDC